MTDREILKEMFLRARISIGESQPVGDRKDEIVPGLYVEHTHTGHNSVFFFNHPDHSLSSVESLPLLVK
jgi:hypothetical protein